MPLVDVVPVPQRLTALLNHAQPMERPASGRYEIRDADGGTGDVAELVLYSEIGGWAGTTAGEFAEALAGITAANLTCRLNSPGGSVWDGLAIANLLRSHPARVTMSVDGIAASIASVIMLAGDEIILQPNAQVMIHDAMGLTIGNPADHREMADLLDRQSDNIAEAYKARAGGRRDSWRRKMQAETWYIGEEAVAAGLADRIAEYPRKEKPAEPDTATAAKTDSRVWDLSVFRYAGRDEAPAPDTQPVAEAENAGSGMVVEIEVNGTADPDAVRDAVTNALTDVSPQAPVLANAASAEANTEAIRAALREVLAEAGIGVHANSDPASPDGDGEAVAEDGAPKAETGTAAAGAGDSPPAADETAADDWAAAVAHLTSPPADGWADAIAHLITKGA